VVFYDNDVASFSEAVASFTFIGTEDFEESTLGNNMSQAFAGPLTQSSTTSPYPNGIMQPIEVSASFGNLAAVNDTANLLTTAVLSNSGAAVLDWGFRTLDHIVAVGLNPIASSGSADRLNTVSVFDTNDNPLGSITVNSNGLGSYHLGILATGVSRIGRINFEGTTLNGDPTPEGGDNADLYSLLIPEPASGSLALMAALGMLGLARRR
jgi:hypothetical protein